MKKFWMIILVSRFETPNVNRWLRWTVLTSDIWIFWEWTENGQTRSPRSELLDVTGEQIRHLITFSIFFLVIFVTFHGTVIPSKVNNTEDVTNKYFLNVYFYNARFNSFFSKNHALRSIWIRPICTPYAGFLLEKSQRKLWK